MTYIITSSQRSATAAILCADAWATWSMVFWTMINFAHGDYSWFGFFCFCGGLFHLSLSLLLLSMLGVACLA